MKSKRLLFTLLLCAVIPTAWAQEETKSTHEQKQKQEQEVLIGFSNSMSLPSCNLRFIHLNAKTIDILFANNYNQAMKTRARLGTGFFVQGVTSKETDFSPTFTAQQGDKLYTCQTLNVDGFVAAKLAKGKKFSGLIFFDKALDIEKPFSIQTASSSQKFKFDKKALELLH